MPDITDTLAPNSQQLDAIELLSGPRVFTITRVDVKDDQAAEQPMSVWLAEFPRPWKPSKNMRRVLAFCWGTKTEAWIDHRVRLFCDPEVTFGKEKPGGTRIAALSHIDGVKKVPVLISQGRSALYEVQPLGDAEPTPDPSPTTQQQPLPDRIEAAVAAFGRGGVTQQQLEAKVALPRDEWAEPTVAELEALFARLAAKDTTKDAEFDLTGDPA